MDVSHVRKGRSGSDFLDYGTGDVRVKTLGNQDEDVDIDDGDTDAAPYIHASVAGVSGGATGVVTEPKSMSGSTLAPRVGVANVVSSTSSHGQKEPHTPGSQASIGRQTLPQPVAGEDGSSKYSDGSIPKVSMEGTSKRVHASEFRKQISKTSGRIRRLSSVQTLSKRKALETEPSTSTPTKRTKVHGNPGDSSDMARKNYKPEEVQPRDIALSTRKEDFPLKRKEIFKDGEGEGREKSPRASEMVREKRPRVLVLGDESDEDMLEQDEASASPKSDGEGKKLSGVKAAAERSLKNDSLAVGLTKKGPACSGNYVMGKQPLLHAGENNLVPLRSAFPLHAKKKVHPPVSGDSKSHTGAGPATHIADENSPWKWIDCTKCKKIRMVNADEDLKTSSWCCERNTRNPKYASCSAPQELNDHRKAEEIHACKPEMLSERDPRIEGQEIQNQTSQLAKEKARRNMVWVKLQVDGKDFWWPGLIVTVVPPATQKKIDESVDIPKAVRLFHPRKDVEEYQVVKRSSLKPFHLLSYKDSSSHPDFIVAVIEADQYFAQPDIQMEGFSQPATGSKEGARPNAVDDYARCHVEDVPHEHAGSNELVFEDVEMPGDDPQCSQLQVENKIETLEDGEVNQTPVKKGRGDISPAPGDGSGLSDKRDDFQFSQPQADKERQILEDEEEVIQVSIEQGKAEDSLEAGHGDVSSFKRADSQCSPSQGDQVENGMPDAPVIYCAAMGASEQGNDQNSPEATNEFDLSDKRDEVSSSTINEVEGSKEIHMDAKVFEDIETSERTKVSDASGFEELYFPDGMLVLNLEISPTRRLIAYDDTSKELRFQDGAAVNIDAISLGKEFNKCSTGLNLHECIRNIGYPNVRSRFPKSARSSNGLKLDGLDLNDNFAIRLRDTWLREYKDEPMPEYLQTRFVAGCILEERGELVNWAYELTRFVRSEFKEFEQKIRESLSPGVLKLIVLLLEKQVDRAPPAAAPLPVFEAVKEEQPVDFTEYDHCCQQCKHGGELLCCDGRGCRKTYHLQCLDPPLEAVPETPFYCPSCLAKASTPPGVEGVTRSVVENDINLHTDDELRQEPQGVAESSTLVGEIDTLEYRASVDSRTNLEVGMVTTEIVGEVPSSKSDEKCCITSADTLQVGVTMLANNRTKDAAHQLPNANAHENEHTAFVFLENNNVVGDRCVSQMDPDATVGEELQIRSSPAIVVDSSQAKKHVLSIDPVESDLEEGEISPSEEAKTFQVDISASKLPYSSTPPLTHEVSARVELLYEEDEFPSSDDHNSICEGCEVGGELMYVTTPSFTSAPSSSLMLCDGKGCKVVYHKECLDPPLQTVPAGEWYCPECEKRKVEKIWSVRNVYETSKPRGRAATKGSDASNPESDSEDEAQDDMPLDARFKSSLQRPDGEVTANDLGKASGSRAGIINTNLKGDGVEYLVQWKSRSHAHDKWVSEKELEKLASKELARFKKSLQLGQVKYDSEWAEPERVIQKRLTRVTRRQPDPAVEKGNFSNHLNAEIEWFVKWKGLGYEYCTWEPAGAGVLATSRGIELINAYERWADAAKQRARRESQEEADKRVQSPFKALKCQPEWMIWPEQEQLDAFNKLLRMWHSRMNGIIVYEASQEKIVMTIMFFLSLVEHYRVVHPILVVVPKSLIQNWEHELYQWAPKLYIVNYASKLEEARDIIRRAEFSSFSEPFRPQIVLTTFDVINCDTEHLKKVEWEVLIIDESRSQRLQKSCQKSYRPFSQIKSIFRLLLLSEPLKSNVEELVQFVNFLEPRKSVFPHGDESTQVTELRRRLAGRVFEYIPKNRLTEYWVPVEMTPVHLDQYYNLLVRHYPTLSRNHRDHQIQEVVTTLRQSCNHPFLADPALEGTMGQGLTPKELLDHHIEISGKMRLVHLMMPILKAAGWRVLIFSQETKQLDILERYMTQSHGSDSYERVDHDIAVNAKEAAIKRFNAEGSRRFVLLLKTGMHVSFKNVQFVLIYDSDWNPENDMRALHKIHNEGEAGSKPLPVLRLYTHLTVEESTLALSRDEQLPSTRASFSAKICQKLLTWGASKIFDHFDNSKGPTRSSYRPKGAKVCPKAKLKQVVYNSEVILKLLDALLCQEEGSSKLQGDELLEAILVPRDEPAPLFAESDHPINMITGDSAQAFWASSLKWRHDDWQAKKGNTLGKGQRGKKRITYDEDAMASAVYNKAQLSEESERKRPRRRKACSEEEQEVVTGSSDPDPVSFQQWLPSLSSSLPSDSTLPVTSTLVDTTLPSDSTLLVTSTQVDTTLPSDSTLPVTSTQVDTALPCDRTLPVISTQVDTALPPDIPDREQLQENTDASQLQLSREVGGSADRSLQHDHASNQNAGLERHRSDVLTMLPLEMFPHFLSKICSMLDLPGPVKERADEIFKYLLQSNKNLRRPRPHHEIFAIQLCVAWLAAEQLNHAIDQTMSICMVEEKLSVNYPRREQFVGDLYKKVREMCENLKPRPALPVVVPTTSQPALVPEIISPRSSLLSHPPRAESEPSPGNVHPQAIGAEVPIRNQLEGSQGTGLQVEAEVPLPGSQLMQETLPVGNSPEVEEAHEVVEPVVVEAGTEVVLVEADPRLVPEEPFDKFINQSRVPEHELIQVPVGTITSGASSLEQGLGWVLVGPAPDIPVETTGQPLEATGSECVLNSESHIDSLQNSQAGAASATLGACPVEVPAQVLPTESTQPTRQNEQTAAAPLESPKDRLYQDKAFIINLQCKEMQLMKSETDRKLQVLKRQYDDCRLRPSSAPGMVEETEKQYKQDKKILERKNYADSKALETRQRADRDKLNDLYSKLISSASGLDVRKIEEEIQRIKDYYAKFMRTSSTPSPLQGSVDQRPALRSIPSSTSAAEAIPTSTVQADGSSHVAQSSATPAEGQQRQHVGRVSSSGTPAVSSQRGHAVQPVTGQGLPHSQRPAAMSTAAAMQPSGVQTRGQLQRRNTAVHLSPTRNVQRGAPAVSRSLSTPALAAAVPPSVGNMARPSAPASVAPLAGSVTGHVYPDVLLKEKEKLNKDLEKAKIAYESESQRIKAEYDREAEILHKKYEALLVEQHRSYTKRQQQVQQNIVKVEWNRQLAEALKLREELAARAVVFAGLATQTAVQPLVNQQAPQQISGRPRTTVVPVHANISRGTTVNGGSGGRTGITMQPPGTSSTRVSTRVSTPLHHSPRYGMPVAPQNEQPRSSMSEAMAVLVASGNAVGPGINAAGMSEAQMETVSPEMNIDVVGSPQPRTSPGVLAPISPPFQDPILAIIRNSIPSLEVSSPNPWESTTSAGTSLPNPHLSEPTNRDTAGVECQIQHAQALPQINPGADSVPIVEETPIQMTSHIGSRSEEQVANVVTLGMPESLIYLSDSDEE